MFNISPEPLILLAAGISMLIFPRLLNLTVAAIVGVVEYFWTDSSARANLKLRKYNEIKQKR